MDSKILKFEKFCNFYEISFLFLARELQYGLEDFEIWKIL